MSRTWSLFVLSTSVAAMLNPLTGCATAEPVDWEVARQLPPSTRFGISGGKADVKNRYPEVVMVQSERGACSGVLATPSLVLTAAHCVCLPAIHEASQQKVDSSKCTERVTVVTHSYKVREGPSDMLESNPHFYQGVVSAYPGFRAEVRKEGVASFEGDLAVVWLEQPVTGVSINFELPKTEVAIDESLIMVGYGDTQHGREDGGRRRFGRNVVTNIQLAAGGNGAFAFRALGAHTREGDSGGPCFRENREGRWLVGINMGHANAGTISLFTSTFHYRAWIAEQIQKANTQ